MDPALVLLWMTLAMQVGTLTAYLLGNHDRTLSLAVLASFVAIGLSLGVPLGNPWGPALIAWALASALAREWLVLYVRHRIRVRRLVKDTLERYGDFTGSFLVGRSERPKIHHGWE